MRTDGIEKAPGEFALCDQDVNRRMAALLSDLASDDFGLALYDLLQLRAAVQKPNEPAPVAPHKHVPIPYFSPFAARAAGKVTAVIYDQAGEMAIDLCEGPADSGDCPRALTADGCVQCAGLWLGSSGWMFKTAEDATRCPLVGIGLA